MMSFPSLDQSLTDCRFGDCVMASSLPVPSTLTRDRWDGLVNRIVLPSTDQRGKSPLLEVSRLATPRPVSSSQRPELSPARVATTRRPSREMLLKAHGPG